MYNSGERVNHVDPLMVFNHEFAFACRRSFIHKVEIGGNELWNDEERVLHGENPVAEGG